MDSFWKCWTRDVLLCLVPRRKWNTQRRDVRGNNVVMIPDPKGIQEKWKVLYDRFDIEMHFLWYHNKHSFIFSIFGVPQLTSGVRNQSIDFLETKNLQSPWCRDLGIILDSHLIFNNHINSLSSSLLSTLCQINQGKHLFDRKTLQIIINSLVVSKLYYCSTVWAGTSQHNIHKLQLISNFAARIMTAKRKYDHISSSIKGLGWMTVQNHLQYCDMVLIFKCKNDLAPKHLSSKLSQRSQVRRYRTRQHEDLNVARCTTALAQRTFFICAPKSWNS